MQFRVIVVTDPQTNTHTHRLQYTAPLSLARSLIMTDCMKLEGRYSVNISKYDYDHSSGSFNDRCRSNIRTQRVWL